MYSSCRPRCGSPISIGDVLAEHVRCRMTEHALRGAIEREDLPLLVDHDDRIDGRVEQGLKLCGDHCDVFGGTSRRSGHT